MVYFSTLNLIGTVNSKEAYLHYQFLLQWLTVNVPADHWELDYSSTICINGVNISAGVWFDNFKDAIDFCSI